MQEKESEYSIDILAHYADFGVSAALEKIKQRFENLQDPDNYLHYHRRAHTIEVMTRATLILDMIQLESPQSVKKRDKPLARLVAGYHDIVQSWTRDAEGNRVRITGEIEEESANEAEQFMQETNEKVGEKVFTHDDITAVREGILATVPVFDDVSKTIIQPNLNENSHIVAKAVAFADLGATGMDGGNTLVRDSVALFLEDNFAKFDRKKYVEWCERQISFGIGRKLLLDKEMSYLSPEYRQAVRGLFTGFDVALDNMELYLKCYLGISDAKRSQWVG